MAPPPLLPRRPRLPVHRQGNVSRITVTARKGAIRGQEIRRSKPRGRYGARPDQCDLIRSPGGLGTTPTSVQTTSRRPRRHTALCREHSAARTTECSSAKAASGFVTAQAVWPIADAHAVAPALSRRTILRRFASSASMRLYVALERALMSAASFSAISSLHIVCSCVSKVIAA